MKKSRTKREPTIADIERELDALKKLLIDDKFKEVLQDKVLGLVDMMHFALSKNVTSAFRSVNMMIEGAMMSTLQEKKKAKK